MHESCRLEQSHTPLSLGLLIVRSIIYLVDVLALALRKCGLPLFGSVACTPKCVLYTLTDTWISIHISATGRAHMWSGRSHERSG